MTWPTGQQANRDNLSSGSDNPGLARIDLDQALEYLNDIIASQNTAYGAVVSNGFNQISSNQIPNNIQISGSLSLEPTNKWVSIKNVLNLVPLTTSQLAALTNEWQLGDMAMISDADAGDPAICFFDGTDWKKLPLGDMGVL